MTLMRILCCGGHIGVSKMIISNLFMDVFCHFYGQRTQLMYNLLYFFFEMLLSLHTTVVTYLQSVIRLVSRASYK